MPELNLRQIEDKLNAAFEGDERRLIFWFDERAEFAEDVDSLALQNARVYHLRPDEQFRAKIFFECDDTRNNYLVYAPYPKPPAVENHLADTIHYSLEFHADRAAQILLDLNMDERCRPILQHYSAFFAKKQNLQAFYALEMSGYNRDSIELGMMAVACKCRLASFEEVLRCVLGEDAALAALEQSGLLDAFWRRCERELGYADAEPGLEKLKLALFVSAIQRSVRAELPAAWLPYASFKGGSIVAFLENLMHNVLYARRYDELAEQAFRTLDAGAWFAGLAPDAYAGCELFDQLDGLLLDWLARRLLDEDASARVNGETIPRLCQRRANTHFGSRYADEYEAIRAAHFLIAEPAIALSSDLKAIARRYTEHSFEADRQYRRFYLHFDRLEQCARLEPLRTLVENVYQAKFLNPLCTSFSLAFAAGGETGLPGQRDFYARCVLGAKERVAVIISDALRYEVGRSLFERLEMDEKCQVKLSAMQSVLPSITRAGMAALLPQRKLAFTGDGRSVLADGQPSDNLAQREALLKAERPLSRAVQFDEIRGMSQEQLRGVFARQEVVYIYHNQIDARGDKPNTENEVFVACEEAVDELCWLIRRLTNSANTSRFIVTADHGFLYKRDRLSESDKIGGIPGASHRYALSDEPIPGEGIASVPLKRTFGGKDARVVNFPVGSDLFKAPGGLNYVHGGCSPQEMIVPLLTVKTDRSHRETGPARLDLISLTHKITNLITTLDFVQTEPVSDVVKEARYRVSFVDEAGRQVSNELICIADRRDPDVGQRTYRLRFTFRNQRYDSAGKYYLVARDERTGLEILRREFIIDLAFADDFGF